MHKLMEITSHVFQRPFLKALFENSTTIDHFKAYIAAAEAEITVPPEYEMDEEQKTNYIVGSIKVSG